MPIAYYGAQISPNQTKTLEGYLVCMNVPIARTGQQEYLAGELGLDGDPERTVMVNRLPEDVFDPAAIASFEGKAVTRGHPPELVGPENHSAYSMGHVENVRQDGEYVRADLYIHDPGLSSDIANNIVREVSCGYVCHYEADGAGLRQTHIRGNHVAVVPKGRAGREVAIQDSAAAEKGWNRMNTFRHSIMTFLGLAAKDAKPEELPGLIETAALALDAEPATPAQEAAPAKAEAEPTGDVMVERAPKGDDLGTKLDRLLEMMESVMKANHREEKELHDGDDLEEMIERLAGEGGEKADPEKAVTIPADELDAACNPAARDAALELLRRVRPAVAAIQDKAERIRVTDALLSAIKGPNVLGQALTAQRDSAAQNRPMTFEQVCAERKAACDARNPHKKKEEA